MPLTFNISKEDILRGKTVTPGWYQAVIKKVSQEPASTDGSTNTIIDFIIQGGEFNGVPCKRYFSEKAAGFAVPFLKACGATVSADGGNFDMEKCIGRNIMIYITNGMYNNRPTNQVDDFRPMGASGEAAPSGAGEAPKA